MAQHNSLTGVVAIHPAAFVQNTDPALDPLNLVTRRKWWIDTGSGNALKVRNEANDGWITVLAGSGQAVGGFTAIIPVVVVDEATEADLGDIEQVQLTYL